MNPSPIERLCVIRPKDFLLLEFTFINLGLVPGNNDEPRRLVPHPHSNTGEFAQLAATGRSFIRVTFPPQSAGEQTFLEFAEVARGAGSVEPPFPVRGEYAGPSHVLFEIAPDFRSAPFTTEFLLKLCFKHAVESSAQTGIEAPFLLVVEPEQGTGWKHATQPVTHEGYTEVWQTRLGVLANNGQNEWVDEQTETGRTLRATASLEWQESGDPFHLPLPAPDRSVIVHQSGDTPIQVKRLMLSALGAWLDVDTQWDLVFAEPAEISEWQHRMTLGRDHYVRTVKEGFLYPFGHRASFITITQRKFQDTDDERTAYLRQRSFIIIRELTRTYDQPFADFPFISLTVLNPVTPALAPPEECAVVQTRPNGTRVSFGNTAFYPRIVTKAGTITDFLFHLRGVDGRNHAVDFYLPGLFVRADVATTKRMTMIVRYNQDEPRAQRRHIILGGQGVAYAGSEGDSTLETDAMLVRARFINTIPPVRPALEAAIVRVPVVNQLTGKNDPLEIDYYHAPDNKAGVFANVRNPLASLQVPTELAGGLAAPKYFMNGLATSAGPLGGNITQLVGGKFNPKDFFGGFSPVILGGVPLRDILQVLDSVVPESLGDGTSVPRVTRNITATMLTTTLHWEPQVKSSGQSEETSIFRAERNGEKAKLTLRNELRAPLSGGGQADYTIDGKLENFTIQLLPDVMDVVHLPFRNLHFHAAKGKKTDVSAEMDNVEFVGPLSFINVLAREIPPQGFIDPPSVDVTAEGVNVNYSLGLPAITLGYFSLQNVSFAAGLRLPLLVDPASLRFSFCERHSPFLLTVSAIGGGGFFGLELSLKGIQRIEFALEFGGNLAFDIGIASGGVLIMAGIYYENNAGSVTLKGYVRVAGAVEVLGLISISVEFNLGLEYNSTQRKAWGVATLTVEVEVLFFSKDVSLTVRREFPKGLDPSFALMIPTLATWQAYCDAFAEYGGPA